MATEKLEAAQRERLGVDLYSVQLELARLQAQLEGHHDANMQASTQRRQVLQQLESTKGHQQATASQASKQRARGEGAGERRAEWGSGF